MDSVRTDAYRRGIASESINNQLVMDIGAGSGILSYFALLQNAKYVFAIEASSMAKNIQKLIASSNISNLWMKNRIEVIQRQIEDCTLENTTKGIKVDVLISEPIGVLLLHERMVESFLLARDMFLKPNGIMIPSAGNIYLAPFTHSQLWSETMKKAKFWGNNDFYGVDFSPLYESARKEVFNQPVVGYFNPTTLLSEPSSKFIDFTTISIKELQDIKIDFKWNINYTGIIHGIAGWFDIHLGKIVLNTSPSDEATHWQQVRFLLEEPLAVNALDVIEGSIHMVVNESRSYDIAGSMKIISKSTYSKSEQYNRDNCSTYRSGNWELNDHIYWDDYMTTTGNDPNDYQLYTPQEF